VALAQAGAVRDAVSNGQATLALLYLAAGEPGAAQAAADDHAARARAAGVRIGLDYAESVAARVRLARGDLAGAVAWARGYQPRPEALFANHKVAFAAFVRVLLAEGRAAEARDWAARQLAPAEAAGHVMTVIELRALQALAERALGRAGAARRALEPALRLAAPEGILRLFLDEGAPMAALLAECAAGRPTDDPLAPFLRRLLAAFPGAGAQAVAPAALAEPLTAREQEILRLIAAGCATPEIAGRLVVTVGTVKTHLHHLYGKLEARDRAHALVRARALGLLD
jgi:LuxR family transcriptional regulator, maltose regulon positive regulatory protein